MEIPPFFTVGEDFEYNNETLRHPLFDKALDETIEAIKTRDGTGVIQVVGPTGAGKSHLGREIQSKLIKQHMRNCPDDKQIIPIPRFSVQLVNNKGFNWGLFYESYLGALQHPFPKSGGLKEARNNMIEAHKSRKPDAMLVDEAHNIFAGCYSPEAIHAQSEVLKSICEDTKCKLVFIGTYDQVAWINCNGQTARRNRPIHFPRYKNIGEDRVLFGKIISHVEEKYPEWIRDSLSNQVDYLFEGSIGLVGNLRVWLMRALNNAVIAGEGGITLESLHATRAPTKSLTTILLEFQNGEKLIEDSEFDRQELKRLLAEDGQKQSVTIGTAQVSVGVPKGRRRRIKQLPHRHPVGA